MTHPLIIIGAGLAGWTTAREFRKLDATTPVLLVTADCGDFYAKPSLSNAFAQKRNPAQLVTTPAARMAETLAVTLQAHTRVTGIDAAARVLHTSQGDFSYAQLVLATGAQAIRVPLAGDAADEVLSVNSLDDFSSFHARVTGVNTGANRRKTQVLIMGAGLIGCEFANDLASTGYAVTVVDPAASPMAALLPSGAGEQLRDALSAQGVTWHFGSTVQSVNRANEINSTSGALTVQLSNGATLAADVVLSAIGLRADVTLANAAGLLCERGVVADAWLRTSSPHIYVLGDAAQYASAGGRTLPYVMPIMAAAKALAATLAGTPTEVVFPLMPVAIKTPAFPILVASPAPGTAGAWRDVEAGLWHFGEASGVPGGFVLAGKHTSRRAEQVKLLAAA